MQETLAFITEVESQSVDAARPREPLMQSLAESMPFSAIMNA